MPKEIEILGDFDKDQLYCAGSVTKLLTTFVVLSKLSEKYVLSQILDDEDFFDTICVNEKSKSFLQLFQKIIGSKFTLHDVCSYYCGLPYTFSVTQDALEKVDTGGLFKHHSVLDEKTFLSLCEKQVSPLYPNRSKFHYSEISIIFLGYLIETIYATNIEALYREFVIEKFKLSRSRISRTKPEDAYTRDLSDNYDYAAVAIQDHGYFCYSNGYYTTLNEMKTLLESLLEDPVFIEMKNKQYARSAAEDLMNGLTIELRFVADDLIYGYEGLSFSGCNAWSYSTKLEKGYLTFCDDEETAYKFMYGKFDYQAFDQVLEFNSEFISNYTNTTATKDIPAAYQSNYQRVKMNDKELTKNFVLGKNSLTVRDPMELTYELMYVNQSYHIKGERDIPESRIELYQAKNGNRYMFYNGALYKQISAAKESLETSGSNLNMVQLSRTI